MKKSFLYTFSLFLILILSFSGCKKNSGKKQDTIIDAQAVYLEALYATSINLPYADNSPELLFDDDKDSSWATMPRAAINEGIMIRFEKPTYIKEVKLEAPNDSSYNNIKRITAYVNGYETLAYDIKKSISINTKLSTLFIKITDVDGAKMNGNQFIYSSNKPVALSEINFFGRDGKKLKVRPPVLKTGKVIASSSLQPVESYNTDFLFDSRNDFGWADGREKKSGNGESLKFIFDNEVTIKKIKIWNGYQRSQSHLEANEALKNIEFGLTGGNKETLRLKKIMQPQILTLKKPLTGKEFILAVKDVFKGSKYKDLVISEMRFSDGNNWFTVYTGDSERRKKAMLAKSKGSNLERVIDRLLLYRNLQKNLNVQTLILRSNGSFILWKSKSGSDMNEKVYADGNWQIKKLSGNRSEVRIFGRLHKVGRYEVKAKDENAYNPYGTRQTETQRVDKTRIFQDFIIIDSADKKIKSTRNTFNAFNI